MDPEQVVTMSDFVVFLRQLSETATGYHGSLEEYLRGVLGAAIQRQTEEPTWCVLAQTLANGLIGVPLPFDPAWLAQTNPPGLIGSGSVSANPFDDVLHMLRYQIADLHRMADDGALDYKYRRLGIISPTGHSWYNFDPQIFLECASSGMKDDLAITACSWADLAIILWLGQIYE